MEVLPGSSGRHFGDSSGPQEQCSMDKEIIGPNHFGLDANHHKLKGNQLASNTGKDAPVPFENFRVIVDTIESDQPCESEAGVADSKWTEKDACMPVWVKRKDKWQVGIICKRADWPLDAVKVKPNHEGMNYAIVFFHDTRNYSWVNTMLVRPISECPQPILYDSYEVGLKIAKDLTAAGCFIMAKLRIDILDIIDRLYLQVFIESARNVNELKKFAMEAPHCKSYPDIGKMLVKLQKMMLQQFIDGEWLQDSFSSWANQCQIASSADAVELLKEELVGSIRWKEINSDKHSQETLEHLCEWKMCKHEAVKLCSSSDPISSIKEVDQPNRNSVVQQESDSSLLSASLQMSHKRPKLSIRRAETHIPLVENEIPTIEIDSGFFVSEISEPPKPNMFSESTPAKNGEMKPVNGVTETPPLGSSVNKSRKCKAFIEAKGRQCVRWANEGDEYCCVHLAARFSSNSVVKAPTPPPVDSPLCGGTTTLGNRCKHRALPGTSFCKKHRPRDIVTSSPTSVSSNQLKRKFEDLAYTPEHAQSKHIAVSGEDHKPLNVDPISVIGVTMHNSEHSSLIPSKTPEPSKEDHNHSEALYCIGLGSNENGQHCPEIPKRHSLYCENHIPSWLKRARNGKSRIISKEVFIDLLKGCSSRGQKLHLHRACELFYKLFKSILSMRNQVPREIQFQWILSEASKDPQVSVFLTKLVSLEKTRITRIWGFGSYNENQISSSAVEEHAMMLTEQVSDHEGLLRCKFCSEVFGEDQDLGNHCIENHNKETQWYFRGYACSICLDSFTNRKVLESHVQERHHAQFSDHCMLFRCIPCGSHFGNSEELWSHVLSSHTDGFRQSNSVGENSALVAVDSPPKVSPSKVVSSENVSENQNMIRKFICKFCGLKFDLLPDLGRHHQAAHMNMTTGRPPKKGVRYYTYRLKSGRLTRPKFKKGIGGVSYSRLKNKVASGLKKRLQVSNSIGSNSIGSNSLGFGEVSGLHRVKDTKGLGRLADTECLSIAKTLFSEVHKTKARPNNHEILAIARTTCCKVKLQTTLEEKYGVIPERLYLKAAKLCSEHYIEVNWHQDGFTCPRGCRQVKDENKLPTLVPPSRKPVGSDSKPTSNDHSKKLVKDECHYVISSKQLRQQMPQTNIILCDDLSVGQETVSIICVIDKNLLDSLHVPRVGFDGKVSYVPWEGFSYITRPVHDSSLSADNMLSMHLECSCEQPVCSPETCDHVYLFNEDHEDAKDIHGQPMLGRFPYNENGQLIVEDGHAIYECNQLCKCSKDCPNKVLQNSIRVKLEVFKTIKKGWGVRARESILKGTFVCELVGEVVDEQEANERRKRAVSCSYLYEVGAQIEKMGIMVEEKISSVIDASKHGNVSRFINHSCSPNLVSRLVLVESMEYELAHIGLYANRDIAVAEELTFDYANKMQPGEGQACFCGSSSCRGHFC